MSRRLVAFDDIDRDRNPRSRRSPGCMLQYFGAGCVCVCECWNKRDAHRAIPRTDSLVGGYGIIADTVSGAVLIHACIAGRDLSDGGCRTTLRNEFCLNS